MTKEEIQKRLDEDYDLTIAESDNKLVATAKSKQENRKWDWKKHLNISFKAFVPQNVSTDLTTSGGNITLSNIAGNRISKQAETYILITYQVKSREEHPGAISLSIN